MLDCGHANIPRSHKGYYLLLNYKTEGILKSEKTELIRFRCTPTEKELIESLAQHRGITVSQLIRDMAEYQATLMALEIPEGAEYDYFMLTFGLFL